jgi:hypothetical protein
VNSQVLLKGCETKGYVILSAAKAEILQRVHRPAWKDRTLVSKTTWVGSLECMQYYATVSAGENDSLDGELKFFVVTAATLNCHKTERGNKTPFILLFLILRLMMVFEQFCTFVKELMLPVEI